MIAVTEGFWVVSVDRATGDATSELVIDKDDAYQRAIDLENAAVATTVVRRRVVPQRLREERA